MKDSYIRGVTGLAVFLLCWASGFAQQVIVNILPVPPANYTLDKIWNIQVVNPGAAVDVTLEAEIRNNLELLVSVKTSKITLPAGARMLRYSDLAPFQTSYSSSEDGQRIYRNGTFGYGSFVLCVKAINVNGAIVGEACQEFAAQTYTPPMLVYPADGSVLDDYHPMFIWIGPTPIIRADDLSYNIRVAEKREGQTPQEAVETNVASFEEQGLKKAFIKHPTTQEPFEDLKTYAWRVEAFVGSNKIAETETWTFRYEKNPKLPVTTTAIYPLLKNQDDQAFVPVSDTLKFVYRNLYQATTLDYHIIDIETKKPLDYKYELQIASGNNVLALPLPSKDFQIGKTYRLEVRNQKKDKYMLVFRKLK